MAARLVEFGSSASRRYGPITWQEPQNGRDSVYSKLAMLPVRETMSGNAPSPRRSIDFVTRFRWGRRTMYQTPMRIERTALASAMAFSSCSVEWMANTDFPCWSLHDDGAGGDLRRPGHESRCVGLHPFRRGAVGLLDALAGLEEAHRGPPAVALVDGDVGDEARDLADHVDERGVHLVVELLGLRELVPPDRAVHGSSSPARAGESEGVRRPTRETTPGAPAFTIPGGPEFPGPMTWRVGARPASGGYPGSAAPFGGSSPPSASFARTPARSVRSETSGAALRRRPTPTFPTPRFT